jgi:hypothetical protein
MIRSRSQTVRLFSLVVALVVFQSSQHGQVAPLQVDLRLLVISANGSEPSLAAMRRSLDYLGTPYTVYVAANTPGGLTDARLWSGNQGFYQGILLATNELGYASPTGWRTALTAQEWETLAQYERTFGVRRVAWYAFPTPEYGFNWAEWSGDDEVAARLTTAGRAVFPYVTAPQGVPVQDTWVYHARPLDDSTRVLLDDEHGHALAAIREHADGRATLALTFDSSQFLLHNMLLSYGVISWVTKGLFIGERHTYLTAQVDDVFLNNDMWHPSLSCDRSTEDTGFTYRLTGSDLLAVVAWQTARRTDPIFSQFRLDMAFNGWGTTDDFNTEAGTSPDTLTPVARQHQAQFKWINHTYDHENLDSVTYNFAAREINRNNNVASRLNLTRYNQRNLVTPDISGLRNRAFLRAAADNGVRYLVSDTSRPGYDNPSPNTGIYNTLQTNILMIPRRPNNLFYNVSLPAEWVAEYNCLYGENGRFPPPAGFGEDRTYAQILDFESNVFLRYMLQGDIDPLMFHQPNLRAFDCPGEHCPQGAPAGRNSLLGHLLDLTVAKYKAFFNHPILSPTMNQIGVAMADRMRFNQSGVRATISGQTLTVRVTRAATVPITGLRIAGAEQYGGQSIAHVTLAAGQTATFTLQ